MMMLKYAMFKTIFIIMATSINFMSYNMTGSDTIKTKWLRDIGKLCDTSFINIQEHFRKSKTISKFFQDEFPTFNSYVIPGYRAPGQDSGRPIAGLAQLSTKSLNIKKTRIKTTSPRIQAQILQLTNTKLLWINAYLPTHNGEHNLDELNEVLREIENISDNNEFDDIIWGADMNWHKGRDTQHCLTIERVLEKIGLRSVWDKFDCDFTHIHTDNKSVSKIDHFMCNERLFNFIEQCTPIHSGDNSSRHSPIMLKLRVNNIPKSVSVNVNFPRRPAWYKAGQDQINRFTAQLHNHIQGLPRPDCYYVIMQ